MKRNERINQEALARAIRSFQDRGGMIRRLPDSCTPRLAVVGARHGQFENPREQLFDSGGYFSG